MSCWIQRIWKSQIHHPSELHPAKKWAKRKPARTGQCWNSCIGEPFNWSIKLLRVGGFKNDCRQFALLQSLILLVHVLSYLNYWNVNTNTMRIDLWLLQIITMVCIINRHPGGGCIACAACLKPWFLTFQGETAQVESAVVSFPTQF